LSASRDRMAASDPSPALDASPSYEIRITPLVRTLEVTGITSNSANITNTVISLFNLTVFARGVCWSTSQNPTIAGRVTIDGHGAGAFTTRLLGLNPGTTYYIRAYAVNSEGFAYGQQISFTTPEPEPEPQPDPALVTVPEPELKPWPDPEEIVPIPDEGFRSYCLQWFDTNSDRQISVKEAASVTEIKCPFYNIKSLQGIEYFTSLKNLSCCDNDLTTLDVSQNKELVYLNCSNNRLSQIDISNNKALHDLNCTGNQLKTLDVFANSSLQTLFCGYNQLNAIDLSQSAELLWVICDCNQLTTLDISHNPNMLRMECVNNLITSLNMNGATSLLSLDCSQNYLIDIDISGTPCLTSLVCRENNLMQLDVSRNHYLTQLHSLNNLSLREIWLNTGQTADDIQKDEHTILKYK
ncbi:MAG: hypothetical protein PHV64_03295, partial [Bacteroidales bacterium]|nr:hypothetical protein [Bacteroidales bacterium]